MNKGFISLNDWLAEETVRGKKPIDNQKRDYYGCVMMDTRVPDWEDMHLAGIDEDDVYIKPYDESYGLEEDPHVTVLYGIHEDQVDSETIKEVIKHNMKPLTVKVDEVDYFPGEEYDVVKYNIPVTDDLKKYRDLFMKFPNTQNFPEYRPHMTLAYVKPGKGKKYKRKLREPFEVTFTKGVYSDHPEGDPEKFTRKAIDLEKDYTKKTNESIEFERGQDPKKTLDIGEDRIRPWMELVTLGTEKILPEILEWLEEIDHLDKYDLTEEEIEKEIAELIETIIEMWDLKRLSEIKAETFKEYWMDIHTGYPARRPK